MSFHSTQRSQKWSAVSDQGNKIEQSWDSFDEPVTIQSPWSDSRTWLPIDAVYTWVNGSDPEFLLKLQLQKQRLSGKTVAVDLKQMAKSDDCTHYQATRLVLIPTNLNHSTKDLQLPHSVRQVWIETPLLENARLFSFESESEGNPRIILSILIEQN